MVKYAKQGQPVKKTRRSVKNVISVNFLFLPAINSFRFLSIPSAQWETVPASPTALQSLNIHNHICRNIKQEYEDMSIWGMVSVCADRETAYICADRVPSVGRLGLQGIISTEGASGCSKERCTQNSFCLNNLFWSTSDQEATSLWKSCQLAIHSEEEKKYNRHCGLMVFALDTR